MMKVKQSEKQFQDEVIKLAKLRGWRCAHFRGVRVARKDGTVYYQTPVQADGAGFPDLVLARPARHVKGLFATARPGRLIFAELKREGIKEAQELQEQWLGVLRGTGKCEVYFWTPAQWSDIEKVLL
jgi:hypothetical protein